MSLQQRPFQTTAPCKILLLPPQVMCVFIIRAKLRCVHLACQPCWTRCFFVARHWLCFIMFALRRTVSPIARTLVQSNKRSCFIALRNLSDGIFYSRDHEWVEVSVQLPDPRGVAA